MSSGKPIDGKNYIGYEQNGIKITDVWKGNGGEWRVVLQCHCGKINRMPLRQALSITWCRHKGKRKRKDE